MKIPEHISWLAAFLIREKVLHELVLLETQNLIRWGVMMTVRSEEGGESHWDSQGLQGSPTSPPGSPVLSSSFSFSHLFLFFSFVLSFCVSLPHLHSLSFSLPISLFSVPSCLPFHFLLSFPPPTPTPLHFATNMYQVSILCPTLWRALKKEQHLQWPLGAPRAQGRSKKEVIEIQFQVVR